MAGTRWRRRNLDPAFTFFFSFLLLADGLAGEWEATKVFHSMVKLYSFAPILCPLPGLFFGFIIPAKGRKWEGRMTSITSLLSPMIFFFSITGVPVTTTTTTTVLCSAAGVIGMA